MEALWLKEISDIRIYFERKEAEEASTNRGKRYTCQFLDYSSREKLNKILDFSEGDISEISVSPFGESGSDIKVVVPYHSFERLLEKGEIGDRWCEGPKITIKINSEI